MTPTFAALKRALESFAVDVSAQDVGAGGYWCAKRADGRFVIIIAMSDTSLIEDFRIPPICRQLGLNEFKVRLQIARESS